MSKRILALLLSLVMVFGTVSTVFAEEKKTETKTETKTDAKTETKTEEKKTEEKKEEAKPEVDKKIQFLQDNGYIKGYEGGNLGLDKNITRAEFATILVRANGAEATAEAMKSVKGTFTDVSTAHWANGFINVAKGTGVILGYADGTFKPEKNITYAEIATMLDRVLGVVTPNEVYPATYLAKAFAEGIFDGVEVKDHNQIATRDNVFKMLYNTITSKKFGAHEVVKGIVLENSRVESMNKDEIVFEVINVIQEANWVGVNRKTSKRGEQYKYAIDPKVGDVEDILGKVCDFTISKDGKVINIKVDDSFQYLQGELSAVKAKTLAVNGKAYTVEQDERYRNEEDRVYRTYFNDKAYKYEDFYRLDTRTYNFAKVTVKNGKVVFIDAYGFKDIAPVKEVRRDGEEIYYYNDVKDGAVERLSNPAFVMLYDGTKFTRGTAKDIAADDVIHIYGERSNKLIVNKKAKHVGKLDKTYRDQYNTEYAVSGETELWINGTPFAPVYSYEGKTFRRVDSRAQLDPIKGREVKMLEALDGSLQLIDSDLKWSDGIVAVRQIASRGQVKFLPPTGDEFIKAEAFGTTYLYANVSWKDGNVMTGTLNYDLHYFDKNRIVYLLSEGDDIKVMMDLHGTPAGITPYDYKPATMGYRYLTVNGRNFRWYDGLKAFYIDGDGNIQQVTDMSKFIKANEKNEKLKAFVLSDADIYNVLTRAGIDTYYYVGQSPDVANTVIFTDVKGLKKDYDKFYAEVKRLDNWTSEVLLRKSDNSEVLVQLPKTQANALDINDIILVGIDKATKDDEVKKGVVLENAIKWNQNTEIVTVNTQDPLHSIIANGKTVYIYEADVFGDNRNAYAQIKYDPEDKNFIEVIRYMRDPIGGTVAPSTKAETVTGEGSASIYTERGAVGLAANVVLYGYNEKAQDYKGAPLAFGVYDVLNRINVGDRILVVKTDGMYATEIVLVNTAEEVAVNNYKAEAAKYSKVELPIGTDLKADNSALVKAEIEKLIKNNTVLQGSTVTVISRESDTMYNVEIKKANDAKYTANVKVAVTAKTNADYLKEAAQIVKDADAKGTFKGMNKAAVETKVKELLKDKYADVTVATGEIDTVNNTLTVTLGHANDTTNVIVNVKPDAAK